MPNKLSQFWQELKRRNVVRVITIYAGAAFVILELTDIVAPSLGLPDWTLNFIIVLLCTGFIISVIVSWIYDVTPKGLKKTESSNSERTETLAEPIKRKLRVSDIITAVLFVAVVFLVYPRVFNSSRKHFDQAKTIAILPFVNISEQSDQKYFVDGITETLIIELSRINALKVITIRESGKNNQIYNQLRQDVDVVLEGSALLIDNRVRVTAKLIEVDSDQTLWANSYDRRLDDVFKIHSDVVRLITNEINVLLTKEEEKHLKKEKIIDPDVYLLYLKGRYNLSKRTEQGLLNAVQFFEEAVAKDSLNAYAYSGLSDSYTLLSEYGFLHPKVAYPKAKDAAHKAIEIDDKIAETHTSYAYVKLIFEWDWIEAEKSFKKAIQFNPNYVNAHQWYSFYLILQNRVEESLAEQAKALDLDPFSTIGNRGVGHRYLMARQYEKAINSHYENILKIDPTFAYAYLDIGQSYVHLGKYDKAISAFIDARNILGSDPLGLSAPTLGYGYAVSGRKEEALEILEKYLKKSEEKYVDPISIGIIYLGLKDIDKTFYYLNKALEDRSPNLTLLKVNPIWDPIRLDSRFTDLCNKIWTQYSN